MLTRKKKERKTLWRKDDMNVTNHDILPPIHNMYQRRFLYIYLKTNKCFGLPLLKIMVRTGNFI